MPARSPSPALPVPPAQPSLTDLERRIAARLAALRTEQGWSLDVLAGRTGISRATLSRLERGELSPTAAMLGRLCTAFGWTLSRLMADAETRVPQHLPAADQPIWTDPETGYRRRVVSPPAAGLRGEMVEVRLPPQARVAYDAAPVPGLEHHLWLLDGSVSIEVGGGTWPLRAGDTLRYVLNGPSRFTCTGRKEARYVIALVHP